MKAILMLEDGREFTGEALATQGERIGEVILNTAVVGYQEMMTNPANAGKIMVLTYPLIGNYGVAPKFNESKKVWLSGLIIKEKSRIFSNWQAKDSFDNFIQEQKPLVITRVDTRTLAVHLRQRGEMLGIISTVSFDSKILLARLEDFRNMPQESVLSKISVGKPRQLGRAKARFKVAILDLGLQNSIIRQLENLRFSIVILPYNSSGQEILRRKPGALIISDGPEQDSGLKEVVVNVRQVLGKLPVLGIATGHQVLAQALGAKISKLRLGHRGLNYPIHNPISYKGEITVQNHSYVVDSDSLSNIKDVKITGYNLNDRSVEELESKKLKLLGVQYSPASPGFDEINNVFKRFMKML